MWTTLLSWRRRKKSLTVHINLHSQLDVVQLIYHSSFSNTDEWWVTDAIMFLILVINTNSILYSLEMVSVRVFFMCKTEGFYASRHWSLYTLKCASHHRNAYKHLLMFMFMFRPVFFFKSVTIWWQQWDLGFLHTFGAWGREGDVPINWMICYNLVAAVGSWISMFKRMGKIYH